MDLDTAFRSWLDQLADELDWPLETLVQHVAIQEIKNRQEQYPVLQKALSEASLDLDAVGRALKKCAALERHDKAQLNTFIKSGSAKATVQELISDFPTADQAAAEKIDSSIEDLRSSGYQDASSAALLLSIILTALEPARFVDCRMKRWKTLADRFDYGHPENSASSYGTKLIWAGACAQELAATATFKQFFTADEPLWVVAGICWFSRSQKQLAQLLATRQKDLGSEREYAEGKQKQYWHTARERNSQVVKEAKQRGFKKNPNLLCEVCNFSFKAAYGELGEEFIEAHHRVPLAELKFGTKTKVEDLALVCANCHRMLHKAEENTYSGTIKGDLKRNVSL